MPILHADPQAYAPSSYNKAYGSDTEHFKISAVAQKFLDFTLDRIEATDPAFTVFEFGCGQGAYLAAATEQIAKRLRRQGIEVRGIGLDASGVAIEQCAERYPDLDWVAQRAQPFIASPVFDELEGSVGLVLNKSGLTGLPTEDDLRSVTAAVGTMLAPGGVYATTINRGFFEKWAAKEDWRPRLFEIEAEILGEPEVFENASSHANLYRRLR